MMEIKEMTLKELEKMKEEINKELRERKEEIFKIEAWELISELQSFKEKYPSCACYLDEYNELGEQIDLLNISLETVKFVYEE